MIRTTWMLLFFVMIFVHSSGAGANLESLQISEVRCDFIEMPGNTDKKLPSFSWIVVSGHRGASQVAYQVEVSSSGEMLLKSVADQWNSGKVTSGQTLHIPYAGKALEPYRTFFYRVASWDNFGNQSISKIHQFSVAKPDGSKWEAKWIGAGPMQDVLPPRGFYSGAKEEGTTGDRVIHDGRSVLLRRSFQNSGSIRKATVSVTGLGFYRFFINGARVGDHQLSPAKTPYHKEILFDTFDVTGMMASGENVLAIHLGNGWYNPYKKWWQEYRMQWFGHKKAILELRLEMADGTVRTVMTDRNWKTAPGPIIYNCIYDGEIYDATQEEKGWMQPGYNDQHWKQANEVEMPSGKLVSAGMPPIRVIQAFVPKNITRFPQGVAIYDFGQNFTGWTRVTLKGPRGAKIKIRHSEELDAAGKLDVTCNENARATAEYTLKGEGTEIYEPQFTYFGFQYAEITADSPLVEILLAEGQVVHSDNTPSGTFSCDNELVNSIHRATVWSQKSNMLSYPMDCPQRDERLGWLGDAQVTAEEAMFNFNMTGFYRNWLSGIRANQDEKTGDIPIISPRPYIRDEGVEWSSTYLTMVWDCYRYYGDKQLINSHYDAMSRYFEYLVGHATGVIQPKGWIGDWGSRAKNWQEGDPESVPTAYFYLDAVLLSKMAGLTGRKSDAAWYAGMADKIRAAYNEKYFHPEQHSYHDGSQMANAFPLYLGLVPENHRGQVLENLVNQILVTDSGRLTTGVLGTKYMPEVLSNYGRSGITWMLVNRKGYPSWSEMMKKYNTMCEFWTLKQSHNHVMMGSIDSWFYETLAGITLLEDFPAFERTVLRPYIPSDLNRVNCSLNTVRGKLESSWEKSGDRLTLKISIPFNCRSEVWIPSAPGSVITESGQPAEESGGVELKMKTGDYTVYQVVSGNYLFEVRSPSGKF